MKKNKTQTILFFCCISLIVIFSMSCKKGNVIPGNFERKQIELANNLKDVGISNKELLEAIKKVPRYLFAPKGYEEKSYSDKPIYLGTWQAMVTPYLVALRIQALNLKPGEKVLEIGSETGYSAAVMGAMGMNVYTIEIVEELARGAAARIEQLGYKNVHVRWGDGFDGWPTEAPFDAVLFACSPDKIPEKIIPQLKEGGRMVISLGKLYEDQDLLYIWKENGELKTRPLGSVRLPQMRGKILEKQN